MPRLKAKIKAFWVIFGYQFPRVFPDGVTRGSQWERLSMDQAPKTWSNWDYTAGGGSSAGGAASSPSSLITGAIA
jgi:hypothetical protein